MAFRVKNRNKIRCRNNRDWRGQIKSLIMAWLYMPPRKDWLSSIIYIFDNLSLKRQTGCSSFQNYVRGLQLTFFEIQQESNVNLTTKLDFPIPSDVKRCYITESIHKR